MAVAVPAADTETEFASKVRGAREAGRPAKFTTADAVFDLPLELVSPAPDNLRKNVGDVAELAASIRSLGILEPLVVREIDGGRYEVVAGHRRLAGAAAAGLERVPAIVRVFTEEERQEAMVVENLQRSDLTALEEAGAYQRLVALGYTQRKIADRIGRSQSHVSKRLQLLDLPDEIRATLDSGGITVEDGLQLLQLKNMPARLNEAWRQAKEWKGTEYAEEWGVGAAVSEQLHEHEQQQKFDRAVLELTDAGVRVVEVKGRYALPKGWAVLEGYDGVWIKPEKHASEPCHAAYVTPYAEVVYLCTDRKRHPKQDTRGTRDDRVDQATAKRRDHERALKTALAARRAFVQELLTVRMPKGEAAALLVAAVLEQFQQAPKRAAAALLGLEPKKEKHPGGGATYSDFDEPLRKLAAEAKTDTDVLRLALALALGSYEGALTYMYADWTSDRKQAYFAFLQRHGYEPSEAEALELRGKGPR